MKKSRIILAGGSGFLGQALAKHFHAAGWESVVITRSPRSNRLTREIAWDAETVGDWARELEGAAAVVNLTGRTVNCRYTAENKKQMIESRVNSTRVIGQAITLCKNPPPVWLNCSSATLYRHTFGPAWDETGTDFSATPEVNDAFSIEIIHAWERELDRATTPHTRKVALRIAMVLGTQRTVSSRCCAVWRGLVSVAAWAAGSSLFLGFTNWTSATLWSGSSRMEGFPVR